MEKKIQLNLKQSSSNNSKNKNKNLKTYLLLTTELLLSIIITFL